MSKILMLVLGLIALVLTFCCTGCDKKDTMKDVEKVAGDLAISALQSTVSNPEVIKAYTDGGFDAVKSVAPGIFLNNLKVEAGALQLSDVDAERQIYRWLQKRWPMMGEIVYREGALGPEGLWVRFDIWLKNRGLPGATLGSVRALTSSQRDELLDAAIVAFGEEYNAVKQLHAAAE